MAAILRPKVKPKPDSINYERKNLDIPANIFNPVKSEIYGLSFFSNSQLSFQPDIRIATPQSYIIGPEDELHIGYLKMSKIK